MHDKLDRRRSTACIVDNTSEIRRSTAAVYYSDRQGLSTARFRRTNQLATPASCQIRQQFRRHCAQKV